jgi:hypothetical protein
MTRQSPAALAQQRHAYRAHFPFSQSTDVRGNQHTLRANRCTWEPAHSLSQQMHVGTSTLSEPTDAMWEPGHSLSQHMHMGTSTLSEPNYVSLTPLWITLSALAAFLALSAIAPGNNRPPLVAPVLSFAFPAYQQIFPSIQTSQ